MCCTWLAGNARPKNLPSGHHHTNISSCIFTTKAHINNREKNLLNSNVFPTCPHNMVNFGLLAAEICSRVCKFQRVSRLGSVNAQHSSSGCKPKFAALNRGRHLYLTGRPSRWALGHISTRDVDLGGLKEPCVRSRCTLAPPDKYD